MLADSFIQQRLSKHDHRVLGAYSVLSEGILAAQRFSLSNEVRDACRGLALSRPSSLIEVIPQCRAPFDKVWLEWEGGDECESSDPSLPVPKRFGVLLECADDTAMRFRLSFAWQHREIAPGELPLCIASVGAELDWVDGWPMDVSSERRCHEAAEQNLAVTCRGYKQADVSALVKLNSLSKLITAPAMEQFLKSLRALSPLMERELRRSDKANIDGEMQVVMAALCMMNSVNCVEKSPVDVGAINKKRKKLGRQPLLSYSEVTINLSKRDRLVAQRDGMSGAEIRQHIVRGHFKIRKGGIYWWRPFIRGSSAVGEVARTGYRLVDSPLKSLHQ